MPLQRASIKRLSCTKHHQPIKIYEQHQLRKNDFLTPFFILNLCFNYLRIEGLKIDKQREYENSLCFIPQLETLEPGVRPELS